MIRTYCILTKPGIIFGNVITTAAGFALASQGHIQWWLFFQTLIGLSLIIASACVVNNYIDQDVDKKMVRTKHRPLVQGVISEKNALLFATILGLLGVITLITYTNILTTGIAIFGFIVYTVLYGIWKRRSTYGTLIGSVAGAVPPVVGYCAVKNFFDMGAFLLFLIVVLWQMPHFFAIAIYRLDDYAAASIPVLPVKKGIHATKVQILLYIIAFIIAACMLTLYGYTGYIYLGVVTLLGLLWLWLSVKGFTSTNDTKWARQIFLFSLIIIIGFSIAIPIDV